MEASRCGQCGAANRAGRKYCAECGAPLGVACSACGTQNEPGERFCGECGTALGVAALTSPAEAHGVAVERRLVSVLFADLVGFTPLSESRDAEDVRELLSDYFEIASGIVGRYGGVVEKFIGDAVMAVWGSPVAQEDDAERAVRAALELVASVGDFGGEAGLSGLAARAAVLTGEAVVNLGASGQGMVAGDLVNTASRVQSAAEPGTVLVGETTRRATDSAIAYADAGLHELKGKAERIPLWRAVRVTAGRAGGLKSDGLEPPFVGRDRELRLAKELFHASADERKAHLLSITGIAGIGKSRLAWELFKYLDGIAEDVAWHRGRCLAYGDGVTYWALAEMVRMRGDIAEGEGSEPARRKLDEMLASVVQDAEEREWIAPRLAQLLSLESHDFEQADLFGGWRLFVERMAERDPVVLVFEDMQWADAALLAFVEYLLEWSRNHRILVLALARPELAERHPHWASGLRNASTLALEPLSGEAMTALLEGVVPGLPEDIREQILRRSEGIPLYAVETVRMLLDRGLLERVGDGYRPRGSIEGLEVPETLQALIASRLDGLAPDERRLLQDAAVLGKAFTRAALATVSGYTEEELDRLLPGLVRKEVLSLQADPRSPERGQYAFLQDLLRQVAYDTLPRRERRSRHLAAAAILEQEWLDGEHHETVEIVASHYVVALDLDPEADDADELRDRTERMIAQAGDRAAALGATGTAQRYFERALEMSDDAVRKAELHERAGKLAVLAGNPKDARSHFEQAIAGFESLGLTHPAARVRARLGLLVWQREGDVELSVAELQAAFDELANDEPDADLAELAASLARPLFFSGRIDEAMARNEVALDIAESLMLPEVLSHGFNTKGLILSSRGRHEEARLLQRRALDIALDNDLSGPALRAYHNLAGMLVAQDRLRDALDASRRGLELAGRMGDRSTAGMITWMQGCLVALGEWDEVLAEERAHDDDDPDERAPRRWMGTFVHLYRGDVEEARARVEENRPLIDTNVVDELAGFTSTEAEVLLAEGRAGEALAASEQAIGAQAATAGGLALFGGALIAGLEAAFTLGDEEKVDELLALVERTSPGNLTPHLRATGARFAARRAARGGDGTSATAGFASAAAILREIEMPFDLGLVLLDHAEWLVGEGRAEEAEPLAAEARDIFERLRAMPYLERLERLAIPAPAETVFAE